MARIQGVPKKLEIWAYQPKMMLGMGKFNQAVRRGSPSMSASRTSSS